MEARWMTIVLQRFDTAWFVLLAAVTAFALGIFPIFHHLIFGLPEKRRAIVGYFDPQAIKEYFDHFYRAELPKLLRDGDLERALEDLYDQRFGRRTYILPFVIFAIALATLVGVIATQIITGPLHWSGVTVETTGLYALAGGYLWVVYDIIARYRHRDLVPSALYGYVFRFLICIPLAYTVTWILPADDVRSAIAFCLGVFPTSTLMLVLRRQAAQRLGLGDDPSREKPELEALEGVNTALAEKFSEIGVTTMLQLAYDDPIQLAMRTNLSFAFIVDLISQALLNVYNLPVAIAKDYSVRGSIEAAELFEAAIGVYLHEDPDSQNRATTVITELATGYSVSETIMRRILEDVYNDPYNKLIRKIWA